MGELLAVFMFPKEEEMKRKATCMFLCIALVFAFVPPVQVSAQAPQELTRLVFNAPIIQLDPLFVENTAEALLADQLFLGLVGLDEAGNIVPELAQSWEVSGDGLQWTFKLREGVPWLDQTGNYAGTVNARDVLITFGRAREYGNFPGLVPEFLNDFSIMLVLDQPEPDLLTALAVSPAAKIIPGSNLVGAGYADVWTSPRLFQMNGPYRLVARTETSVQLEATEYWVAQRDFPVRRVLIEFVQDARDALRRYLQGEFDLIELGQRELEGIRSEASLQPQLQIGGGAFPDLFSQSAFTRLLGNEYGYLTRPYLFPVTSPYFGLNSLDLWGIDLGMPEPQVPGTTRVLDNETLRALTYISPDQSRLEFDRVTPQLDVIFQGNIIVGDSTINAVNNDVAPYGFLRRVADFFSEGGRFVVITEPAALEDAILYGEQAVPITIDTNRWFIEQEYPVSAAPQWNEIVPVVYAPPYAGVQVKIDDVIYDEDNDENTTDDQVRASGSISVEPGAQTNLDLSIQNHQLQWFQFSTSLREKADIKLYSSVNVVSFGKRIELKRITFFPYTVLIGPVPLVITPQLSVFVGAKGDISVGVSTGINQSSTITTRVWYENGRWDADTGISDHSVSRMNTDWNISAGAEAYAGPQLSVLLYGVAGPYGELKGYLSLKGGLTSNPKWKLTYGIKAELGVKIDALSFKVYGNPFEVTVLPEQELDSDTGSVTPPTDIPPAPAPTSISPPPTPTPACTSILWPPGCWTWWIWVIVVIVALVILAMLFG